MPAKSTKHAKKPTRSAAGASSQRAAQVLFALVAVVVILSMVLSVTMNF